MRRVRASVTQPVMAKVLGVAHRTYASYERNERLPDADALRLLVENGWNANWLLTGDGPERLEDMTETTSETGATSASQPVSDEALTIALELADKAIGDGFLPRPRYAKLVRLLYEGITQGLPVAEVLRFGLRAGQALATGDDVNGSEQEVGGTGRTAAR